MYRLVKLFFMPHAFYTQSIVDLGKIWRKKHVLVVARLMSMRVSSLRWCYDASCLIFCQICRHATNDSFGRSWSTFCRKPDIDLHAELLRRNCRILWVVSVKRCSCDVFWMPGLNARSRPICRLFGEVWRSPACQVLPSEFPNESRKIEQLSRRAKRSSDRAFLRIHSRLKAWTGAQHSRAWVRLVRVMRRRIGSSHRAGPSSERSGCWVAVRHGRSRWPWRRRRHTRLRK